MALPHSRKTFRDYCLRKLGWPVVEINLDDDQIDDRINEALLYYADYHFDGTEKLYYKAQLTEIDIVNKYISLPDNIIGTINIFDLGSSFSTNNLFNLSYQFTLNNVFSLNSISVEPYVMARTHLQFLEQVLVGKKPIRYNRHINRCYIDMDWTGVNVGDYLILECYMVVDPDEYTKVWADRWLGKYATILIKENWGQALKKFKGMKLPGGIEFNGKEIYDEAVAERKEMEKEAIYSFSLPNYDLIG